MYKEKKLKNGLKIITSNMPHMESVSIGIWIGVGGRYESKRLCGISHIIEHMLFKGTVNRTANDLKEAIEGIGGNFNAFTGEEVTCYLVKLPASHMELGLDVLSDMVINPSLDSVELEKEKNVICEEIKMYIDQPSHHVFDILSEALWPNHPLGRPIAGYINSIKKLNRKDLLSFKNSSYVPSNIRIVACGKVNEGKCAKSAEKYFAQFSSGKTFSYSHVKKDYKRKSVNFLKKDTEQTHLALGFHTVHRDHPLRYAMLLLNVILGGNMSSRLFDRLREHKALCYDISSSVKKYKDTGAFVIHAGVDNSKMIEAAKEIIHELKNIKETIVSEDELSRAKEYSRGQLLLALEDTATRMIWLGDRIVLEGKAPAIKDIFKKVDRVTTSDIKNAANMVFNRDKLNFAAIGPINNKASRELRKVVSI